MKRLLVGLLIAAALPTAASAEWVNGYLRSDGVYVPGYYRSPANGTPYDNYSTQGNVNPYTGQQGTEKPTYGYTPPATNYQRFTPYYVPVQPAPSYTPPRMAPNGLIYQPKDYGSSYQDDTPSFD